MYPSSMSAFDDSLVILDDEFDRTEVNLSPEHSGGTHFDDLGWEDQLDAGEEMSL